MLSCIVQVALLGLLQLSLSDAASPSKVRPRDGSSFENPPATYRPRFRYWLPDSSVNPNIVKENIRASGALGAGGVEFLPFFDYGATSRGPPPGSDWSTFNFGTPAFRAQFKAALEAHREGRLTMDFAMGPNQGQGVPAEPDDEGLQWDLIPFSTPVPSDGVFKGAIPGWGEGELVAAVSALVVSEINATVPVANGTTYLKLVLKNGTLTDISKHVSTSTGFLSTKLPSSKSGRYRLFIFYQRRTHNHNIVAPESVTKTIFDNGSFTVDHFSARGAQTVTKFWEQHILIDGLKELLQEVGDCGWEDSMELRSNISWSPTLPSRFQRKLGYSIKPFLPLIQFGNNNINLQRSTPGTVQVVLDVADQGAGYVNDYRMALAYGYQEYLSALVNWTHSLGLRHRSQISYNLPMDMEASIPYDDIPECESLQFRDNVDAYRQFSGTAWLAGKNVVSVELGAIFGFAFSYTLPNLVFAVNRAASGGINRVVIHGQSYTGNYYATTWPGYTAFHYGVSDSYMDKQPKWNYGLAQALHYIGRIQYVQQQGIGKYDLAFYNRQSATNPVPNTLYTDNDLKNEGYTYAYLSPDNFKLRQAYVHNGVLAPEGPAFKAIIVQHTQTMTLSGVQCLEKYAESGLPVIFLQGDPSYYPSRDSRGRGAVEHEIFRLKSTNNVHSVAKGELIGKLRSLGLAPQVRVQTNGTWWTTWREDKETGIDYTFVFSDSNVTTGEITVASIKKPYIFDAWTGNRTPLLHYKQSGHSTVIPLRLAANQTVMIGFTNENLDGVDSPTVHITEQPSAVIGSKYSKTPGLVVHVAASLQPSFVQLSSGKRVSLSSADVPAASKLKDWTLIAEHWEAPSDISNALVPSVKHNTTHHLSSLVSWTEIPGLVNASGVGYYTKEFSWAHPTKSTSHVHQEQTLGAYIRFMPVLNAITLYINSQRLPPLDFTNPIADISPYLHQGANKAEAVVPTTMLNYLRSIEGELRTAGQPIDLPDAPALEGLVGAVSIIPYKVVSINSG